MTKTLTALLVVALVGALTAPAVATGENGEVRERTLGEIILLPGTAECVDMEYDVYPGLVLRHPGADVAYAWNPGGTAYRAVAGADTRFCVRRAPAADAPDAPGAATGEDWRRSFLGDRWEDRGTDRGGHVCEGIGGGGVYCYRR